MFKGLATGDNAIFLEGKSCTTLKITTVGKFNP